MKVNADKIKKKTDEFWNDKKVVDIFADQPVSEYWIDFFKLHKETSSDKRVLDLGCGGGRNLKMLLDLGYDVFACDLHKKMVDITREEYAKYVPGKDSKKKVVLCSMIKLPYEDNFFDIILSHGVYHNAVSEGEFIKALRESARVLKKDGYLCFNIFGSASIGKDLREAGSNLYLTKEGLLMVLLSSKNFLKETQKIGLILEKPIIEYVSQVSTGRRAVMRGILRKIS